jgi:hypothetical protein
MKQLIFNTMIYYFLLRAILMTDTIKELQEIKILLAKLVGLIEQQSIDAYLKDGDVGGLPESRPPKQAAIKIVGKEGSHLFSSAHPHEDAVLQNLRSELSALRDARHS